MVEISLCSAKRVAVDQGDAPARQAAGSPSGGREVRRLLNAKVYDSLADLMAEGTANELLVTVSRSSPEMIVVEAFPAQREKERGAA